MPFFIGLLILRKLHSHYGVLVTFFYGFSFGFLYHLAVLSWIVTTWSAWHDSLIGGTISTFLLCTYAGIYIGLITLAISFCYRVSLSWELPFIFAVIWVSGEYLVTQTLGGLTWTLLGYTQWEFLEIVQASSFTGIYGISFLVVLCNAALAQVIANRKIMSLAPVLAIFFCIYGYGKTILSNNSQSETLSQPFKIQAGILHSNIDLKRIIDPDFDAISLTIYARLLNSITKEKPLFILWPETSLPDFSEDTEDSEEESERITRILRKANRFHIAGALTEESEQLYNSAVLFSPDGKRLKEYKKIKPVYFAERMPLPWLFTREQAIETVLDIVPGGQYTLLEIPVQNAPSLKIGANICWEPAFPNLIRHSVSMGANVLTNLSEGLWLEQQKKALSQHFMMNRFRSVENRRFTLVSGNRLHSGVFDPYGRIQKMVPGGIESAFIEIFSPRSDLTFYTRHGDWLAYGCMGLTFLLFVSNINIKIKERKTD